MTLARKFISSKTYAVLGDDGFWNVIADMAELRQVGDNQAETRTMAIRSIDKDLQRAIATANNSLQRKFVELGYDLFNIPKEEDGKYFPYQIEDIKAT